MVPVAVAGNILGEATPPAGNIFNEAMRGLRDEFNRGEPLSLIATKHGRTPRAIRGRLELLGLLEREQRATGSPFLGVSAKEGAGK